MEFQKTLRLLFAKNNQNKFEEINKALKTGDIEMAHRLVHTLKSNAGQIGKTSLQSIAADMEHQLKDGVIPVTEEQLKNLETELKMVLDDLAPLLEESPSQSETDHRPSLEPEKIRELIEKLEPLLRSGNAECLNYINDLRAISGSEQLIQQIDDFQFESSLSTLAELKKGWL